MLVAPTARSTSPSPSTSPHASVCESEVEVLDHDGFACRPEPSLKNTSSASFALATAMSRSPSPSMSASAMWFVFLEVPLVHEGLVSNPEPLFRNATFASLLPTTRSWCPSPSMSPKTIDLEVMLDALDQEGVVSIVLSTFR